MPLVLPRALVEVAARTPTTDLYFRNPLRRITVKQPGRLPRLESLAPHLYKVGRTAIVSRYGAAADLQLLRARQVRRIIYIADDDFEAGAADPTLPANYRGRLAAFAAGGWPLIKAAADIVVVSSPVLQQHYGLKARLIHPAWRWPPATTAHFHAAKRFEMVHLGTASHGSDIAPLAPMLADVLRGHPRVRLTLFPGAGLPDALKGLAQVRSLRPLPWWRYKIAVRRMRFHLALYPLRDSAFNAARSANKLFEQAVVGAASLMSPNPALRDVAGGALPEIFVEGGPEAWRERIEASIADQDSCRERAEATREHILAFDPLGQAARHWLDLLAGEI